MVELTSIGTVHIACADAPAGPVDLLIRPERLRPLGNGAAADNVFDMTVDDAINYGDSVLAIGKTKGLPLRARLPGAQPEVLRRGEVIRLAWSAADAHVLARR
jgi:putative spermidine/putrescine transport system ATP-binding protein